MCQGEAVGSFDWPRGSMVCWGAATVSFVYIIMANYCRTIHLTH